MIPEGTLTDAFAADVVRDLQRTPKELQSRYLYDALGSSLFDAICRLPRTGGFLTLAFSVIARDGRAPLSSEDIARVYGRLGFKRVGTACIVG